MYLQDVESIWDLSWNADRKYGDIWLPLKKVNASSTLRPPIQIG
jgi:glycyl-tRNA synthetase alpha subunit